MKFEVEMEEEVSRRRKARTWSHFDCRDQDSFQEVQFHIRTTSSPHESFSYNFSFPSTSIPPKDSSCLILMQSLVDSTSNSKKKEAAARRDACRQQSVR